MSILKFDLDKETAKQLRTVIFRPFILSLLVGIGASVAITLVAVAMLGVHIQDGSYTFMLDHSDGWILFTIFVATTIVIAVISYYRLREEHQKLVDDVLTPFRKELEGEWRVYWTDKSYSHENGESQLIDRTQNDYCRFGIDNLGKLYIDSELHNHDVIEDWKRRIEDISINLQANRLTFYDEAPFTIRKEKMRSETDDRTFDAKFFVFLEVSEADEKKRVTRFTGKWYDLDGIFAKFKETVTRQTHIDLPKDIHFPRSGTVIYEKSRSPVAGSVEHS
jgi:hypothetical protein